MRSLHSSLGLECKLYMIRCVTTLLRNPKGPVELCNPNFCAEVKFAFIFMCRSGVRSGHASHTLHDQIFNNMTNDEGVIVEADEKY